MVKTPIKKKKKKATVAFICKFCGHIVCNTSCLQVVLYILKLSIAHNYCLNLEYLLI